MSDTILIVFEGKNPERGYLEAISQHYFQNLRQTMIVCSFCQDIYELYRQMQADEDLDLFMLLKEIECNKEAMSVITSRDNVSDIYLLFDYDGHAIMASDDRLTQMLTHFDDELNNGKLYISYPMIESLKHLRDDTPFQDETVQSSSSYKHFVSDYCVTIHPPCIDTVYAAAVPKISG